jgi:prepilin-type processing-associated H-X9-DG protein
MGKKLKHHFTIYEGLLIACVLIILAAVLLPLAKRYIDEERQKAMHISCIGHLKHIGLAIRMYSQENSDQFPYLAGRSGFEMLRSGGYLENGKLYTCPSTTDTVVDGEDLRSASVSYLYASGMNESTSVDSGLVRDRDTNHNRYGNVLFVDGHASGYAGATWTASANYLGLSSFSY